MGSCSGRHKNPRSSEQESIRHWTLLSLADSRGLVLRLLMPTVKGVWCLILVSIPIVRLTVIGGDRSGDGIRRRTRSTKLSEREL